MAARHEQRMAELSQKQAESAKKIADIEAEIAFHKAEMTRYRAEAERYRAEAERYRAEAERYKQEGERYRAEGERQRAEAERERAEGQRQQAEFEREAEVRRAEFKAEVDRDLAAMNKRLIDSEEKLNQKLDSFHTDSRLLFQAILEQSKTVDHLVDSIRELRETVTRHAADPSAHRAA